MSVLINASTSSGLIQSADTSGEIELQSNGTTALKVNTNEGIQILNCLGVGNATPSTSGAGITFPATQSASTDANTLDDYEEGSWTPSIGGNATYTSRSGRYVKVGKVVHVLWDLQISVFGTGSPNEIPLPFAADANGITNGGSVGYFINIGTSLVSLFPRIDAGGSTLIISGMTGANTTVNSNSIFQNNARVTGCITYITA
jgi:hypothetical protein